MSAPRPFETDPFHPLGSIYIIKRLLYICENLLVISSMWDAHVCVYDNCACAVAEIPKLRLRAIFKVTILFLGLILMRIDTTFAQSYECLEANLKI